MVTLFVNTHLLRGWVIVAELFANTHLLRGWVIVVTS
jgi:hypothetical protein